MRHNKSHVRPGVPSTNWKCKTPSTANAYGHGLMWSCRFSPWRVARSLRTFCFSFQSCPMFCDSHSLSMCQCTDCRVVASPGTALLPSISLLVLVLCWLVLSGTSGDWDSVWSMWSEPTEKCHTMQVPPSGVCWGELAFIFALRDEDLHSQQVCISVWWVEIGIKPVQRREIWGSLDAQSWVRGRCWQGWGSWQWQPMRLWQWGKLKGGLKREKVWLSCYSLALFCVHIGQLDLPGQLGLS